MIIKDLLAENSRYDKRDFLEPRSIQINKIDGGYILSKGKQQIVASFQKSTGTLYIDKPQEGIVNFNVFLRNKKQDRISNLLTKIYIKQRGIDIEKLCIKFGKECYIFHIEIILLSVDGTPYELLFEGCNLILNHVEISFNFVPFVFYFSSISNKLFRDPIRLEEEASDWMTIVIAKNKNEIVFFEKTGRECMLEDLFNIKKAIDLTVQTHENT